MEHFAQLIAEQLANFLVLLLALAAGKAIEALHRWHKRPKHSIDNSAERDRRLAVLLAEIGVALGADRTYISSYHNGSHYVDGSDILKCSRTHEWVTAGGGYEARNHQDVLVSLMPEEARLVADKSVSYVLTQDIPDGRFRRSLAAGNISAVGRCAIRRGNDIVGFIGVDFIGCSIPPKDIDEILPRYAWRVESVQANYR